MGTPLVGIVALRGISCRIARLLAMLATVSLVACSAYEGHIVPVDTSATPPTVRQKPALPFTAAVVVDAERKQQRLMVNKNYYRVHPDVTDVLARHLSQLFSSVDVAEEAALSEPRPDYLLYPDVSARQDYSSLNITISWRVVDAATGKTMARVNAEGASETEKTLLENLTGRSMDISSAISSDKSFSSALTAAAQTSLNKLRTVIQQKQAAPVAHTVAPAPSRQTVAKVALDSTPPVIEIQEPAVTRGLAVREKGARIRVLGRATDESGVAEVFINGVPAMVDANGNFSGEALLKPGSNEIVVSATDTRNNSSSVRVQVVRDTQAVETPKAAPTGRRIALLIGINNYRYLDKLKTAVADVRAVAKELASDYGYETRLLLDDQATLDAIMREFNQIRERLTPDDKLLIYYAGHGILEQATDASYWLPFDAEPKDDTKWLDSKRISDHLKRLSTRQVLVVADSCYSGTISRSISAELTKGDIRENYLKKLQTRPSRVLISSGGNEPVADSGGGGHSIFASVFIESLKHPPTPVFTAAELLTGVIKESVAGRSAQTPEHKIIRNSGHDSGDFVFEKIR